MSSEKVENRICQNCKGEFIIDSEDFNFYEKIKVPPPTFCHKCRLLRRMANTNERVLYKRKCDLTGESILSMFPEDAPFPVYKSEAWYSDDWDPYKYRMDYNFSKPFFEQFKELLKEVPRMALVKQGFSKNSEYTHRVHDMKDSYMVFRMSGSENSSYCYVGRNIVNCVDCISIWDCELCYECLDCNNCYKTRFSQESHDCRDSFFFYACRNCSDCVGCVNLVNQSYCIFNKKYTKEEYETLLPKIIKHMKDMPYVDKKGVVYKYGENFPIELSPFAYNETAAIDFFSFSKTEVEKLGYRWKEKEKKNYETTIRGNDLPETIEEVSDEILKEIIECAEKDKIYSVGAYRITQNELSFYRRMDLPLPRVCFDVRHTRRLAKRPLPVLHNRICKKCGVEVETIYTETFAPIVCCEKCYQQEVY